MQNISQISSVPSDSDKDMSRLSVGVLQEPLEYPDTPGYGVYVHGIEGETDPQTFCYFHCLFCYLNLGGMTPDSGVRVIGRLVVGPDRHGFEVEFTGLKNARGTATSSQLSERLESDECLREVYEMSTAEIERILEVRREDYGIRGYVWEDQETADWNENVIEVKTRFRNFEEKEELWDILGDILETTQKHIAQVYHREIPEDRRLFVLHLSEMG